MQRGVRLVAALVLVAGGATFTVADDGSACSWIGQDPLAKLAWAEGDQLLASDGWQVGLMDAGTGRLTVLFGTLPTFEAVVSPDGRWLVVSYGDTDPRPDASGASCEFPYGATEAVELATGERTVLARGASHAIAATEAGVAFVTPDRTAVVLAPWGSWDQARSVPTPVESSRYTSMVAGAEDGSRYALVTQGGPGVKVHVLDRDARSLGTWSTGARQALAAVSPDGSHVAVLVFADDGTHLQVLDDHARPRQGASRSVASDAHPTGAPGWLAWSSAGLAVADPTGVTVHPDAPALDRARRWSSGDRLTGGLAWSPDASRLAVGTEAGLVVLDDRGAVVLGPVEARTEGEPFAPADRDAPPAWEPGVNGESIDAPWAALALGALVAAVLVTGRRERRIDRERRP